MWLLANPTSEYTRVMRTPPDKADTLPPPPPPGHSGHGGQPVVAASRR